MSSQEHIDRAEALIEALPFIQRFRGSTFVIKYGGSAMEDDSAVERLLRDVVFLEAVGINPVLIHGGGKAITAKMREAGIKPTFVDGLRVTDARGIEIVRETLDGVINPRIVASINEFGGRARGLSGTAIFRARRLAPRTNAKGETVDLGFVGDVTGVHAAEVEAAIAAEEVPVISPVCSDDDGAPLNVNADTAAGALAAYLKAAKLVYLSDVLGIMRNPKEPESLIPSVNRAMIAKLLEEEIIEGGMIPKVESAVRSLGSGVGKVHLIDGRIPHALLLETFTNSGVGTEIVP